MKMMEQDKLLSLYQDTIQSALEADEGACVFRKMGQYTKASSKFQKAGELYAKAAQIMLDLIEECSPDELPDYQKSVDRLMDVSREMKSLAKETAQNDSSSVKKGTSSDQTSHKISQQEDDEAEFLPIAEAPGTCMDDVVGLEEAKEIIMDEIIHPIQYKELYRQFGKSNGGGLLLFGPPGGGKTMLARAIAAEAKLPFFSVRCSDIVGKYFGDAEKRIRALFQSVRRAENAVVFLDEAEALACRRGGNSTVMNRLVPELLSQIDGFEKHEGHVIVLFATNRPYDIDPAFLRYGRLSTLCYVPLPEWQVRLDLITKQIERRPHQEGIDFKHIADCTKFFSCADIINLIEKSTLHPIKRTIRKMENGDQEIHDVITQEDLELALKKMQVSVEQAEISKLEKWMVKMHMPVPHSDLA